MRIRTVPFLSGAMLVGWGFLTPSVLKAQDKPNIILFLVDDMGWQDTSVPFWTHRTKYNDIYETPNMERLAEQGVKFTQAYASSVSSPTRVSLMTGMNAARHRVTNWTLYQDQTVDAKSEVLSYPEWNVNGMSPIAGIRNTAYATPFPRILQDNGYYTIHCGKAHFGAIGTPAADPITLGFDVNIAGHAAGGLGSYLGEDNFGNKEPGTHTEPWGVPGLEKYHQQDIFVTEALTREACTAMDKARETDKPFFLYMSHYAIHIPINKDKRYYQKYIDKGLPEIEAAYAGLIEGMDKSLGDIMDYLDNNGLAGNTILIFMSDNGGLAASNRAGQLHIQNAPLNSGKGSAYEGGIREPMIVRWPGVTQANTVCDKYLIIEDFYPTILEMAQVYEYETVQHIDGRSFTPFLKCAGDPSQGRALFWNFPNNWGPKGPGIGATCVIRKGDYKLIYYYEDQRFELFNIMEDIGEVNNLALVYPAILEQLAVELTKYLKEVEGQRPSFKDSGSPVPWPDEALSKYFTMKREL